VTRLCAASEGCDKSSQFDCGSGVCVHKSLVCNGHVNCNKSRDEANCTHNDADSRQYDMPAPSHPHFLGVDLATGGFGFLVFLSVFIVNIDTIGLLGFSAFCVCF